MGRNPKRKNPRKKPLLETLQKEKDGARPNRRLIAAAPSPQLSSLLTGSQTSHYQPPQFFSSSPASGTTPSLLLLKEYPSVSLSWTSRPLSTRSLFSLQHLLQPHFLPSPPTEAITTISQNNPLSTSPHQQLSFFLSHLPIAIENQHPKTQWFQPQAAAKQRQFFLWTQLQQQPLLFGPAFRVAPISQRNNNKQRRLLLSSFSFLLTSSHHTKVLWCSFLSSSGAAFSSIDTVSSGKQ